jgi:hypothetical protein
MINDTSFMRNPNYHKISDTIETLNFSKITEVVNSCYHAITKLDHPLEAESLSYGDF